MAPKFYRDYQAFVDEFYGQQVRVYYNPNSYYDRIIVKALRNSRWVNVYKPSIIALTDVTFHVLEAARKRVADQNSYNAWAYVLGRVVDWSNATNQHDRVVLDSRNEPYWGFVDNESRERYPLTRAPGALINRNNFYI